MIDIAVKATLVLATAFCAAWALRARSHPASPGATVSLRRCLLLQPARRDDLPRFPRVCPDLRNVYRVLLPNRPLGPWAGLSFGCRFLELHRHPSSPTSSWEAASARSFRAAR